MSASISFSGSSSDRKVRVNAIDPPKELNISGTGVTVTDNPGTGRYDIVISGGGGGGSGTLTGLANVGAGTGTIFRDITLTTTANLKSLIAGSNLTITNNPNDITISNTATPLAKGTAIKSGDDTTKVFTIAHGMSSTPVFASVIPTSSDALGSFITTLDATNITITYSVPPPATVSNNLTYVWVAMDSAGGGGSATSAGEANTMSNSGVDGLSIVLAKSGVNLPVKGFNVGSSKLSITDDTTDHTIDYDVVESNLTLSNMGGTLGYSKLVLTNSIVNTDIATSAGIAHSKIGTNLLLSETGLTAVRTVTFPDSNGLVVYSADSRMTNARTPTVHASTHQSGGSDSIALDTLAATTDITTLNASTSAHGLLKKLSGTATQYLDGTGAWSTPAGGGGGGFTEAKGSSTQSGTASATVFTIAHTLGGTPTWVSVIPKSTDADDDFAVTVDATNITITYPFPPPNITSNLSWWWRAAL